MKKPLKKIIFLFTGLLMVFIILVNVGLNSTDSDSTYYKSVGLKMNGIVTEVKPLIYGHDYGVISINIEQSNISEYDKRKELKRYFGVIKNGKANLVFNSISSISVGDSLVIDTENYQIFRNEILIDDNFIGMPLDNFIFTPFKEIKKKIQF